MTRMTENLPFCVTAIHPSGLIQCQNGRVTATRQFLVPAVRAEEFGLRMLGKWRGRGGVVSYQTPQLPAYFPYSYASGIPKAFQEKKAWPFRMIATGFTLDPIDNCCFNSASQEDTGPVTAFITDAQSIAQAERYYPVDGDNDAIMESQCKMQVTVQYQECPWDCTGFDGDLETTNILEIMDYTAIAVERTSSYILQTLPNRNLVWADLPGPENQLKGDTYATILIPTADITIDWFNVPLSQLCQIETHLNKFRNRVNCTPFTLLSDCMCLSSVDDICEESGSEVSECLYEEETVLFIDWEELKEQRTRGFRLMDTTTLRLMFKQRRINTAKPSLPNNIVGWNHLYCDSTDPGDDGGWRRVARNEPDGLRPLYEGLNLNNMFNLLSDVDEGCPN